MCAQICVSVLGQDLPVWDIYQRVMANEQCLEVKDDFHFYTFHQGIRHHNNNSNDNNLNSKYSHLHFNSVKNVVSFFSYQNGKTGFRKNGGNLIACEFLNQQESLQLYFFNQPLPNVPTRSASSFRTQKVFHSSQIH